MNIDDVKTDEKATGSVWSEMFARQHKLSLNYIEIERRNGFWMPDKINEPIDNAQFQAWLKSMFWRATEEIAEAFEVTNGKPLFWLDNWKDRWSQDAEIRHFFEELADALHFLVEPSVYVNLNVTSIDNIWVQVYDTRTTAWDLSTTRSHGMSFICGMGEAANCLKNKPWKETQMPTDAGKFRSRLTTAWLPFLQMWADLGFSDQDVFALYCKKNQVNQFRQATRY